MNCPDCNTPLPLGQDECPNCGIRLSMQPAEDSGTSCIVMLVLAAMIIMGLFFYNFLG